MKAQPRNYDLNLADAVLLLEPPNREVPALADTSRAVCSYGLLLLIPVGLIVAGFVMLARVAQALPGFSAW